MNVLIYTKKPCQYCDKAKNLMKTKSISYTEIELGIDMFKEDFMALFPEQRTVPLIIIDEEKIGGYEQFKQWINSTSTTT